MNATLGKKLPFDRFQGSNDFPDDGHFFDTKEPLPWYADTPHWSPVIDFHSTLTVPMPWDSKQAIEARERVLRSVFGNVNCSNRSSSRHLPKKTKTPGEKDRGGSNTSTRLAILPSESSQLGML